MRLSPRRLRLWRRRRSTCNRVDCRFSDGRCETCGFALVDQTRDHERLLDPRF